MNSGSFIPFVLATAFILIIPGPTIILVISQAVVHGRKAVVPLVTGVLLGDFTAMTFSLAGLGAVISASAVLFSVCKWIGAMYLFYLGIKLWSCSPKPHSTQNLGKKSAPGALFQSSFIVTALNPKSIAFFIAFLPQFIDPGKAAFPQLSLLGGTFLIMATFNATLYAVFAGQLSEIIRKDKVRKWFNRCGGGALIGAGIITAGLHQSS